METKQKGAEALAWPPISPALLPRNKFCARREGRVRGLQAHLQKDKGSLGMAGNAACLHGSFSVAGRASSDSPPYAKGSRDFAEGSTNWAGSEQGGRNMAPSRGPLSQAMFGLSFCLRGWLHCGTARGLWGLGSYVQPCLDKGPVTSVHNVQQA